MNTPSPKPEKSLSQEARAWLRSKRLWSAVMVLLFLFGIGGLVPVSKIPFLRNLVYAMGYSPDETHRISFFKALLSWNEHSKMMRGELPDPDEVNVFGAKGGAFNAAKDRAQNKLIDMRLVNASLTKQGKKGDYITGVYDDPMAWTTANGSGTGADSDKTSVNLTKDNVSAQTQANAATNSVVFFGEDASAIARDKNDAYNSVNTLKKAVKLPIAGGSKGTDWFSRAVDRAVRGEVDFSEFIKKDGRGNTAIAQLGTIAKVGDTPARRDMYWAWMMGRAARRTPQVLLKKTLAAAGFDGADMPRTVFSSSGVGGVAISADDVISDMTNVQNYLDQDKNCQDAVTRAKQQIDTESLRTKINSLAGKFPQTCADRPGEYLSQLQGIINGCQQMKNSWESAQRVCGTLSLVLDNNQCHFETLTAYYTEFDAFCAAQEAACAALEDPDEQTACMTLAGQETSHQDFPKEEGVPTWNADQLDGDYGAVKGTLYNAAGGFNTDFFPGVNWGRSLRVNTGAFAW